MAMRTTVSPNPPVDTGPRALPNNVPAALSSFFGRTQEVAALRQALNTSRVVTVLGPGGAGKTRLAREVAATLVRTGVTRFDGVWWVDLAPIRLESDVAAAVASALSISTSPGRRLIDALTDSLRGQRALMVFDNCEHLIEETAQLADAILRSAPGVTMLCTSREALAIDGEVAWPLPSLPRPATGQQLRASDVSEFDAVQLFVERARAAKPAFALTDTNASSIAIICARLDGLPLALELAAALVPVLGVEALVARLDDALSLLSRGKRTAVPRHRTLRAVLDWSYALLEDAERTLLRRLSVFRGSFTLDAMEEVCAAPETEFVPALGRLVEHSLVEVIEEDGEARYRLLETVRQFGSALLAESPEQNAVRRRHAEWVARIASDAEPAMFSPARGRTVEQLRHSVDEIRAALTWAASAHDSVPLALCIAGALGWFWLSGVPWEEGRALLELTLAAADSEHIPDAERPLDDRIALGRMLYPMMGLAYFAGDTEAMLRTGARELALWDSVDKTRELTAAQRLSSARGRTLCLQLTGLAYAMRGESALALAKMNECIAVARQSGDQWLLSVMRMRRALVHFMVGDHASAQSDYEASVPSLRELGESWFLSLALEGMAMNTLAIGDAARAATYARESVTVLRTEPDGWFISRSLDTMAFVLSSRKQTLFANAGSVSGNDSVMAGATAIAAQLMGAAEILRERCGAGVIGPDVERNAEMRAMLETDLGEAAFRRAFHSGKSLSLTDVFALMNDDPVISAFASEVSPVRAGVSRLMLRVLGHFELSRDGVVASGDREPSGKVRELLLFLLLHERATKDEIGLALWPDASAAQVRNAFHVTLHHLRRQLGPERWIVFERNNYSLNRAPSADCIMDADVDAVLRTSAQVRKILRRRETVPAPVLAEARAALERFRGDLAHVSGEWMVMHQDRVSAAWAEGMDALAQLFKESGQLEESVSVCEALLARDSLRETTHRLLMECLELRGERARALAHFASLVTLLRRELGSGPSAQTVAIADRLRR